MHYLFHLGHPAHFHLFKNVIRHFRAQGDRVSVLIKKKDILEELMQRSGIPYVNILPEGRKDTRFGMIIGMLKRDWRLLQYCRSDRPDMLIGTSVEIGHVGTLLGIPAINVNEDDADVIPFYCKLSYPWCNHILSPSSCNNGKWESKSIKYEGYHELAYLHPAHFTPDETVVRQYIPDDRPYFLIRFAKLTAHHDKGIQGIDNELASQIVERLKPHGQVFITSERELDPAFEPYRLAIDPLDIHHVMAFAEMYIGDSQTMAAEAGVLGVPFIRFNDFVGRIGYLAELEDEYELGYGIRTKDRKQLLPRVDDLLSRENLKATFAQRRQKMLADKRDVATFFIGFLENYPTSVQQTSLSSQVSK